ncbi:MAG: Xanthine and dehydrogenase maturation factor, XdhC/CoxF family [Deltaproteobacteria bacterium]|nr:Xanthine and dehydrogenase maturation factor, XdhC/CoxF family [Deltaproteobacteria bacterium]
MTERSIVEAAARLRRHAEPYLVATVVNVRGSTYRRPGARMLLTRFRWVAGTLSGGCLEGDLSHQAWWRTRYGGPVIVTYDSAAPAAEAAEAIDDDVRSVFGLGCEGVVEVLLERTGATGRIDALEVAARCLRAQRRGAVATVFRAEVPGVAIGLRLALVAGGDLEEETDRLDPEIRALVIADMRAVIERGASANRSYAGGMIDVFIEAVLPPPRLFLFGTGHDAIPVAQLGRSLGWDVVVCTSEQRHSTRDRFTMADEVLVGTADDIATRIAQTDRAVAVVMHHDLERDRESVAMLLGTKARYIGVLGPRARTELLLEDAASDPRIHAPVELALGAETPQEIALALASEMMSALAPAPVIRERIGMSHERGGDSTATIAAA